MSAMLQLGILIRTSLWAIIVSDLETPCYHILRNGLHPKMMQFTLPATIEMILDEIIEAIMGAKVMAYMTQEEDVEMDPDDHMVYPEENMENPPVMSITSDDKDGKEEEEDPEEILIGDDDDVEDTDSISNEKLDFGRNGDENLAFSPQQRRGRTSKDARPRAHLSKLKGGARPLDPSARPNSVLHTRNKRQCALGTRLKFQARGQALSSVLLRAEARLPISRPEAPRTKRVELGVKRGAFGETQNLETKNRENF
ncbi:hypothetical protein TIFTF001_026768 [Ficus carica]|uniref:Uncharacterized protein n=1 Tax=Ficus carica TaxID=3494 RepID=A0AA88DLT3_FICCA|nr:hypothetical protein TIFTF001_026768 [Ficus carica]